MSESKPIWKNEYRNLPNDRVYPRIHEDLLKEGMYKKVQARENIFGLSYNSKTGASFDCTTLCPKHVRGLSCAYCYVDHSRDTGFNAKLACSQTRYEGELMRLKDSTIKSLNEDKGGLRLFSFGDYIDTPQCNRNLQALMEDAKKRGLRLKAVTKRPDFIHKYHDKVDTINVSVDSIGSGVRWREAKALKAKYPNVKIRTVALDHKELDEWGNRDWVDVITPYHGPNVDYRADMDDPQYRKEIEEREREGEPVKRSMVFRDMTMLRHPELKKKMEQEYSSRTCCMQGNCGLCKTHCGAARTSCTTQILMKEEDTMTKNDIARVLKGGSSIKGFMRQSAEHGRHPLSATRFGKSNILRQPKYFP